MLILSYLIISTNNVCNTNFSLAILRARKYFESYQYKRCRLALQILCTYEHTIQKLFISTILVGIEYHY